MWNYIGKCSVITLCPQDVMGRFKVFMQEIHGNLSAVNSSSSYSVSGYFNIKQHKHLPWWIQFCICNHCSQMVDIISQESGFNTNLFDPYSLLQRADPSGTEYFALLFCHYHKSRLHNPTSKRFFTSLIWKEWKTKPDARLGPEELNAFQIFLATMMFNRSK